METLLPLFAHPGAAPDQWAAVEHAGPGSVAILNVADGPGSGRDPGWTTAIDRLAAAGVAALGYVDLGLGVRPIRQVRADVRRWAGYPVAGLLFDQAPSSPFLVGPVATAVAAARRCGLERVVVNAGLVPDPLYRTLRVQLGVFEGSWAELRESPPEGAQVGDVYLVHGVPPAEVPVVQALLRARGATAALVTDAHPPTAYERLPSWYTLAGAR